MQKHVNPVDLVKRFLSILLEPDSYSNEHLLEEIGVDTGEYESLKVWK